MDDFGVNVLRRKMFIHAKLTPMAKPKKPSVSTTKVGLVKVKIETAVDNHTGKTRPRYRTYCTKAIATRDQRRREWPSNEKAHAFVAILNASIKAGKIEEINTENTQELKRISQDFRIMTEYFFLAGHKNGLNCLILVT